MTAPDTLRVGDRAVPLAEIEAGASDCGHDAVLCALVAELRRLRAVESAAQAVVDCEAGDARARLLARLALILAAAPDTEGGTDGD